MATRPPLFPTVVNNGVSYKECSRCHTTKPLTDFASRKKNKSGRASQCKFCVNMTNTNRRKQGVPPRQPFVPRPCTDCKATKGSDGYYVNEFCTDGYERRCKVCKAATHKGKYNLTRQEYQRMVDESLGLCAICGKTMEVICIDHDHSCCPGQGSCGSCIRGLLCVRCNMGLGNFGDDVEALQSAVLYLQAYLKIEVSV